MILVFENIGKRSVAKKCCTVSLLSLVSKIFAKNNSFLFSVRDMVFHRFPIRFQCF